MLFSRICTICNNLNIKICQQINQLSNFVRHQFAIKLSTLLKLSKILLKSLNFQEPASQWMLAWHKSFEEHYGMCVETEKADYYTAVIRVCNKVKFKKIVNKRHKYT